MDDKRPVVPTYCFFQGCYDPDYEREIAKGKAICYEFNRLHPNDRPSGVVACGVPCRVTRKIGPDDRTRYPMHESLSGKFER